MSGWRDKMGTIRRPRKARRNRRPRSRIGMGQAGQVECRDQVGIGYSVCRPVTDLSGDNRQPWSHLSWLIPRSIRATHVRYFPQRLHCCSDKALTPVLPMEY
jgi:hypothetical protein